MVHQFTFSIRDITRKKYTIILLIFQFIFSFIYLSITGSQVINSIKIKNYFDKLDKYNITYYRFSSIDLNSNEYKNDVYSVLFDAIEQNYAYSAIPKDPEINSQYKLIVVLGAFNEIFDLNSLYKNNDTETVCYIGKNVDLEIGDSILIGERKKMPVEVVAKIPSEFKYAVSNRMCDYENTIVVSTNLKTYDELYYMILFAESTMLVNPSQELLTECQLAVEKCNADLLPVSLMQYKNNMRSFLFEDGFIAAFLFAIVVIFVLISSLINILQIIEINKREYSIHILYGATVKKIYLRTFLFVTSITVPIIIIYYFILDEFLSGVQIPMYVMILFMCISSVLLTFVSLREFINNDIYEYYKRSE